VHEDVPQLGRQRRDEAARGARIGDAEDLGQHLLELGAVGHDHGPQRGRVLAQRGREGPLVEEQVEAALAQLEDAFAVHRTRSRVGPAFHSWVSAPVPAA